MTTINSIFVAMWEAHRGNWETLFAAMRHLDVAREALGLSAAGITMTVGGTVRIDQRRAG